MMMFLFGDHIGLLVGMTLMMGVSMSCAAIGIRGMRRNTPPAVKNAVKSVAKTAAKTAVQSQIRRMF